MGRVIGDGESGAVRWAAGRFRTGLGAIGLGAIGLGAIGLVAALGGCDALEQAGCDTAAAPGLVILVSQGDGGPASCTATVTVTAEDGSETILTDKDAVGNPCTYNAAYNRPGTYKITAKQSGWSPAVKAGVVVESGTCHVHTVSVTMVLIN